MKARGCKGRHEKESLTTEAFLDRQEFKNFARCGPEPVTPVTEASPPWDPITELPPSADAFEHLVTGNGDGSSRLRGRGWPHGGSQSRETELR